MPFLRDESRGAFVLCRSSNPTAGEFQELGLEVPLYASVAKAATNWNVSGNCGLVIGADAVEALAYARRHSPDLPLLIPGVGAQKGDLPRCLTELAGTEPATFLVNASPIDSLREPSREILGVCGRRSQETPRHDRCGAIDFRRSANCLGGHASV